MNRWKLGVATFKPVHTHSYMVANWMLESLKASKRVNQKTFTLGALLAHPIMPWIMLSMRSRHIPACGLMQLAPPLLTGAACTGCVHLPPQVVKGGRQGQDSGRSRLEPKSLGAQIPNAYILTANMRTGESERPENYGPHAMGGPASSPISTDYPTTSSGQEDGLPAPHLCSHQPMSTALADSRPVFPPRPGHEWCSKPLQRLVFKGLRFSCQLVNTLRGRQSKRCPGPACRSTPKPVLYQSLGSHDWIPKAQAWPRQHS